MVNKSWGQKRRCAACAAAFYDLERTPINCPKCGAAYEGASLLKSDGRPRKKRGAPVAPPVAAKPAAEDGELAEAEVEHVLEPDDDEEAPEDDAAEVEEDAKDDDGLEPRAGAK